jgi:hypothetical protein
VLLGATGEEGPPVVGEFASVAEPEPDEEDEERFFTLRTFLSFIAVAWVWLLLWLAARRHSVELEGMGGGATIWGIVESSGLPLRTGVG